MKNIKNFKEEDFSPKKVKMGKPKVKKMKKDNK